MYISVILPLACFPSIAVLTEMQHRGEGVRERGYEGGYESRAAGGPLLSAGLGGEKENVTSPLK